MSPREFEQQINEWLQPDRYRDYCPNGLQVESHRDSPNMIVSAVTASLEAIQRASELGANTLLVHHGYFWKNEPVEITGIKARRIKALMDSGINLFAYHLPLDFHAELGNNTQLGNRLGLNVTDVLGERRSPLGAIGEVGEAVNAERFSRKVSDVLGREVILEGPEDKAIHRVAWCTGGGQHFFSQAIDAGVDLYLTGEISEPQAHLARESGVCFIAAGHHATERYGVQALGEKIAGLAGVKHHYVEIDNPA